MRVGLSLILVIGLLSGCSTASSGLHPSAGWISRNGGVAEGVEALRVRAVAQRFAGVVEQPFEVHVLKNDTPTALAWPSGDLFLTRGLVRMLDDHEIAAVIAHELGHLLTDGQRVASVALAGRHEHHDSEIQADDRGLRLLEAASTSTAALRTALQKVLSYHELRGTRPRQLAARIARLP